MGKKKKNKRKQTGDDQKKNPFKHSASETEVNALKAMMKQNIERFRLRLDDQNEENKK